MKYFLMEPNILELSVNVETLPTYHENVIVGYWVVPTQVAWALCSCGGN